MFRSPWVLYPGLVREGVPHRPRPGHAACRCLTQAEEGARGVFRGTSSRRPAMLKSMRLSLVAAAALAAGFASRAGSEQGGGHGSDKDHVVVRPDDLKWGPAPPSLPS